MLFKMVARWRGYCAEQSLEVERPHVFGELRTWLWRRHVWVVRERRTDVSVEVGWTQDVNHRRRICSLSHWLWEQLEGGFKQKG